MTNTGNTRWSSARRVGVKDDNGTPGNTADDFTASYVSGDTNNDGYLDLTETWLYQAAPVTVRVGAYLNTTTVSGFEPHTSQTPTSADSGGYFGDAKAEGLTPGFWKNNADNKSAIAWPRDASGNLIWDPGQAALDDVPGLDHRRVAVREPQPRGRVSRSAVAASRRSCAMRSRPCSRQRRRTSPTRSPPPT